MTITPTDPAPTTGPTTGPVTAATRPGRSGDGSSASQFLAAIVQALSPTGTPSSAVGPGQDAPATAGPPATEDTAPAAATAGDPTAPGLGLPPGLASQLAALVAAGASAGAVPVPVPTTAAAHANVADVTDGAVNGPTSDIRMSGDAATAVPVTGHGAAAAQHRTAGTATAGDAPVDAAAARATDAGDAALTAPSTAATPAGTPPTSVAATVVPAGMTPVMTPVSTPAATSGPAHPVTGQVFPEVTALVSRGDGTHRITLTLKPEALGEVRVVMTVRDGAVHVRLAAGHEAQQALLEGSPELTRLLEHAGATDSRIVVRDLSAPAPTSASADAGRDLARDTGQGLGSGAGTGGHPSQNQHAGTRAEHLATDGAHRSTTTGANPLPSDQPATRTRPAGVDVAM